MRTPARALCLSQPSPLVCCAERVTTVISLGGQFTFALFRVVLKPVVKQKCLCAQKTQLHPRSSPSHPDAYIELPCARCNRISEALVEASRNSRVGRVLHATSGFVTVGHFRHLLIVAFADAKQYKFAQFALLC